MAGRPFKEIDEKQVEVLASVFCTNKEIAAKLGCSDDTLTRNYADALQRGRESAKASLRALQFKQAQKGNVTMLIWLGKQYLGQSEKYDFSHATDDELISEAKGFVAGVAEAGSSQAEAGDK